MALPHVGIVVPVYNDWSGLQNCLSALADQTYPAEDATEYKSEAVGRVR